MKTRPTQSLYAILYFVFMLMMGVGQLSAQVPMLLGYDGYLLENKKPANGVRNMEVRLHDAAIKGKLLYNEKVGKVSVSNGEFYFEYGSKLGEALKGGSYWMEVVVNGKAQSPRERLVAVPFALKSGDAQQAMGSVNALSGNVTKLGAQVLGASSNASAAMGAVNALSGNVTTQVAELQATIQALSALSSNFTTLQTQTSSLSSNLTTVQGQVNGVSSNVTALSSNVTALQGQTGNLTSNVTALTSAQGDKLAALEATIQDLRAELADTGASKWGVMVTVQGGTHPQESELAGQTVDTFQIGKYEVTWGEWKAVRSWAINNGYDLDGQGSASYSDEFQGFNQISAKPVDNISWHAAVKWCNAKSEMEGKTPFYTVNGTTYKTGYGVAPTASASANGYRLPTEKEWEWAARGGEEGYWYGFTYSGSYEDGVDAVAWTSENNSPNGPKAVGTKMPNLLGIYDMSGNLFEYCEDVATIPGYPTGRRYRGGSWLTSAEWAALANRGSVASDNSSTPIIGFRLARSSGN